MVYLHCCKDRATAVKSPIDFLDSVNAGGAVDNPANETLRGLLSDPAMAVDRRRLDDDQQPPTLRIFAGQSGKWPGGWV